MAAYLVDGRFDPDKRAVIFKLGATVESSLTADETLRYQRSEDELTRAFDASVAVNPTWK